MVLEDINNLTCSVIVELEVYFVAECSADIGSHGESLELCCLYSIVSGRVNPLYHPTLHGERF